jgi:hypothetical protein
VRKAGKVRQSGGDEQDEQGERRKWHLQGEVQWVRKGLKNARFKGGNEEGERGCEEGDTRKKRWWR